ncbi:hypothetical protein D4764_15G0008680 [Takifugu flavidus]|uniref:Secreted protein n=1 Tax=Takifugu flavidus TaxID=433684 RepID=A0A5C6P117_9TELE|nr:hypothetical protein D4764_15G0008680 [Takifugu flavidus]
MCASALLCSALLRTAPSRPSAGGSPYMSLVLLKLNCSGSCSCGVPLKRRLCCTGCSCCRAFGCHATVYLVLLIDCCAIGLCYPVRTWDCCHQSWGAVGVFGSSAVWPCLRERCGGSVCVSILEISFPHLTKLLQVPALVRFPPVARLLFCPPHRVYRVCSRLSLLCTSARYHCVGSNLKCECVSELRH